MTKRLAWTGALIMATAVAVIESLEKRPGLREEVARSNMQRSIQMLIEQEFKINDRMRGRSEEMKNAVMKDREKTYAVVLTAKGVSQATAEKVVKEIVEMVKYHLAA